MINDGENLRLLFSRAKKGVVICAPYIKTSALKSISKDINEGVLVKVYTRLSAADIFLGVSDIDVFDYCQSKDNFEFFNIDNLHAKLFASDDIVLVGSANVTNSALGWTKSPNVEILSPSSWEDPSVFKLSIYMSSAKLISEQDIMKVKEEIRLLDSSEVLRVTKEASELKENERDFWLPRSSIPEILYEVYIGTPNEKIYTESTIEDALDDICALSIPKGLSKERFYEFVGLQLYEFQVFNLILSQIPKKLNESAGIEIMRSLDPSLDNEDCRLHWNNVLLWVAEFFSEKYEVAPVSFELRLK